MMQALLLYTTNRFGNISTMIITDLWVKEYAYMSGCNLAILVPENHTNKQSISPGLLSQIINEGSIVTK